jgi:hypothetical protein
MNINFTFNEEPFLALNVPSLGHTKLNQHQYPTKLKFNHTYYKYDTTNQTLSAFRVLALSFNRCGVIQRLTQYPNRKPFWEAGFYTDIFESKEDFLSHAFEHNHAVDLGFHSINQVFDKYKRYGDLSCYGHVWKWDEGKSCPINTKELSLAYFYADANGANVCIKREENYYLSKEECAKANLGEITINEFADDVISIQVEILPNTPKVRILKVIEF